MVTVSNSQPNTVNFDDKNINIDYGFSIFYSIFSTFMEIFRLSFIY